MIGRTLPRLTIAVLAAGYSARLGQPKPLATINGASLLRRTLAALRPFTTSACVLVIAPPRCGAVRRIAHSGAASFIGNPRRVDGLATSVRCAIFHARYSAAVLLLPVDLARLQSRDLHRLIACWRGRRRAVVARRMDGNPVTPLILPHVLYQDAARISGDQGLRDWVRRLPRSRMSLLSLPSAAADVDTPSDLARARRGAHRKAASPSNPENRETR